MSFLVPFKGRNRSTNITDNILYQEKNIFIMDNHRLALWCWFQKIDKTKKYNLFHLDAHPDMSNSSNESFKKLKLKVDNLSLEKYQTIIQPEINLPIFRWDNYLQIMLEFYPEIINKENTYSATHKVGSNETLNHDISGYQLLGELNGIFSGKKYINENKWIMNLDLDYFFSSLPEKKMMYSLEYLEAIAMAIKNGLDNEIIQVLTIAMSPECCGGWLNAEKVLLVFSKVLKIKEDLFDEN